MDRGVAVWGSPQWRARAAAWIDERLAAAGLARAGEIEQPRLRPWGTVLRVPTEDGPVWMKAGSAGTGFEAALYELLARTAPEHVLAPLAVDAARGWVLLPDGGAPLGERLRGDALLAAFAESLIAYGRLQRALAPHVEELVAIGVEDMRPAALPARFGEALDRTGAALGEMRGTVAEWARRLAASPLPPSLDHNDLHPMNVLAGPRFYDWGDSVVAHPFAAMLVPLWYVRTTAGEARMAAVRDAYLEGFADLAPRAELAETLEIACRAARIARALVWHRAIRTADEQGEALDPEWADAPRRTLERLADADYTSV